MLQDWLKALLTSPVSGRRAWPIWLLALAGWLGTMGQVRACEPILPLMIVTAQPQHMSAFFSVRGGLPVLAVLLAVVIFKSGVFAWLERRELRPAYGFGLMLLGNVFSTIVGIFSTLLAFSSGVALLIGMGTTCLLAIPPAGRLRHFWQARRGKAPLSAFIMAFLLALLLLVSLVLFGAAAQQSYAGNMLAYWLLKFTYVLVGIGISLFLSALWEEYVIQWGYKVWKLGPRQDFVVSSLRANLYALVLVGALGAAIALPERMRSPNFLISLWQQLAQAFG